MQDWFLPFFSLHFNSSGRKTLCALDVFASDAVPSSLIISKEKVGQRKSRGKRGQLSCIFLDWLVVFTCMDLSKQAGKSQLFCSLTLLTSSREASLC